nr:GNAT family N-acetyltransferase [Kineococcus aurantiacus]
MAGQRTDAGGIGAVVDAPGSVLLLAERDGALVGCCELRQVGQVAYFGTFAVDPAAQGGGIGRRLLTRADAEAVRRWGASALEMTVIVQRADLIAWYERLGFTATGERRPFPYGDERFGRPLRDDLEFVVLRRPTAPTT